MDDLRATLSALMGSITEENSLKGVDFSDNKICKLYLTGLCPHDLFGNTKHYMGQCPGKHSDELRERYMEARKKKRYYYEEEAIRIIQPLVDEADRKISRGQVRCDDEAAEMRHQNQLKLEEINKITKEVDELMIEVEKLGNEGKIDESIRVDQEVQKLNEKKNKLEEERTEAETNFSQNLKPCEICGALLSAKDSDRRLSEHFSGKIHIGFQMLRKALQELKEYIQNAPLNDTTQGNSHREYPRDDYSSHNRRDNERSTYDYDKKYHRDRRDRHEGSIDNDLHRSRDRHEITHENRDRYIDKGRDRRKEKSRSRGSSRDRRRDRTREGRHKSRHRDRSRDMTLHKSNRDDRRLAYPQHNEDLSDGEFHRKEKHSHEHRRYRSNTHSQYKKESFEKYGHVKYIPPIEAENTLYDIKPNINNP